MELTVSEAAELLGVTERAIRKKIETGEIHASIIRSTGGKGRPGYMIPLSSLPVEAQRKYWTSMAPAPADSDSLQAEKEKEEATMPGINYSLAELEHVVGKERFQEMMAEAEYKMEIIEKAMNPPQGVDRTIWMERMAEKYGKTVQTLYRDIRLFKEFGVLGLMRKSRLLTQGPQRISIHPEVCEDQR
jgi:putative transposase